MGNERSSLAAASAVILILSVVARAADSASLYGVHWWGYTQGSAIDATPAVMLGSANQGGWDVETVLTHSGAFWWTAAYFAPLYADLFANKNVTIISRIDYNWGETVPSPTSLSASGWATSVVGAVNSLAPFAHIWIIGNECNLNGEATNWPSAHIAPAGYANIYRTVRNAIRSSAATSPAGTHIVLIAPVSPGGILSGVRWISGTDWLGQVIDNIPAAEIDGFAMHAYGGSVTDFHNGYVDQLAVIDSKGLPDRPVYITEWNRYATPGSASEEATAAQLCREAFADVNTWNMDPCHHNIVSMSWFVYDADQQGGGGWDGYSIEYWKDHGNPAGNSGDLFTAFEQTVSLHYPAGGIGTPFLANAGGMINATPTGTNVAINLPAAQVVTDSNNTGAQTGVKAVDGVVSSSSKWVSANTAPAHWLKLDLGSTQTLTGYIVRHAQAGGEPSTFNTQSFYVQSAPTFDGPWTNEVAVCNSAQSASVTARSYPSVKAVRYVRLYITDAGVDNYARIPEFEVYSVAAPVSQFAGSPVTGKVPLTVTFSDQSINGPTSWSWDYGDSGTSSQQGATHTYTQAGIYNVTLTVGNVAGTNSLTKTAYVTVQSYGADFDHDGDVDQIDFGRLQACFVGPNVPPAVGCFDADVDGDLDVDSTDASILVNCLSGSDVQASANCH